MTDAEVALEIGVYVLFIIVLYIKAYHHFKYLQREKEYFAGIESFFHLVFHPIQILKHLPEIFVVIWAPILTFKKGDRLRNIITSLCYIILFLICFIIFY